LRAPSMGCDTATQAQACDEDVQALLGVLPHGATNSAGLSEAARNLMGYVRLLAQIDQEMADEGSGGQRQRDPRRSRKRRRG
jgi:hypothetical protein